ncbi:MarR family transcriptional regulator [soil metagenome]
MSRSEASGRVAPPKPAPTMPSRSIRPKKIADPAPAEPLPPVVDLDRYVPAFLTWIANKLSRGASQHYLTVADVGIETWRCLVLLAIEGSISAQQVSKVIGMDKGSVSRCFKSMQAKGLITLGLDAGDGRVRIATLTKQGRKLHDQMLGIAMERERALLAVLNPAERDTLIALLSRLHENLPEVDAATERYVAKNFPKAASRQRARSAGDQDE